MGLSNVLTNAGQAITTALLGTGGPAAAKMPPLKEVIPHVELTGKTMPNRAEYINAQVPATGTGISSSAVTSGPGCTIISGVRFDWAPGQPVKAGYQMTLTMNPGNVKHTVDAIIANAVSRGDKGAVFSLEGAKYLLTDADGKANPDANERKKLEVAIAGKSVEVLSPAGNTATIIIQDRTVKADPLVAINANGTVLTGLELTNQNGGRLSPGREICKPHARTTSILAEKIASAALDDGRKEYSYSIGGADYKLVADGKLDKNVAAQLAAALQTKSIGFFTSPNGETTVTIPK